LVVARRKIPPPLGRRDDREGPTGLQRGAVGMTVGRVVEMTVATVVPTTEGRRNLGWWWLEGRSLLPLVVGMTERCRRDDSGEGRRDDSCHCRSDDRREEEPSLVVARRKIPPPLGRRDDREEPTGLQRGAVGMTEGGRRDDSGGGRAYRQAPAGMRGGLSKLRPSGAIARYSIVYSIVILLFLLLFQTCRPRASPITP